MLLFSESLAVVFSVKDGIEVPLAAMNEPTTVDDASGQNELSETSQPKKNSRFLWWIGLSAPVVLGIPWTLGFFGLLPDRAGTWCGFVLLFTASVAAVTDHQWKIIPNWATYTAFLWLVLVSAVFTAVASPQVLVDQLGTVDIGSSLMGGLCCFVLVLVPYILGVGGAGDAKIAAVIGAGLGVRDGLLTLALTFVIAAFVMLLIVIVQKGPVFVVRSLFRRVGSWVFFWIVPPDRDQRQFLEAPLSMGPSFLFALIFVLTGILQDLLLGAV